MTQYVPPKRTPLTPSEAGQALMQALGERLGGPVSAKTLALAMAQSGVETGQWKKMYNFNWGNVKALGKYNGPYTCLGSVAKPVSEVIGGREFFFVPTSEITGPGGTPVGEVFAVPPGHPQTRFRAYDSPLPGAQAFITTLATSDKWPNAWPALQEGNAESFVRALKAGGYFTANEARYLKAVTDLRDQFLTDLQSENATSGGWTLPLFF